MQTEASFIIYQTSDGLTHRVDSTDASDTSGADASAMIQTAIDKVNAAGGGSIFIKRGDYVLTATLALASNLAIDSDGAKLSAALMAMQGIAVQNVVLHGLRFEDCTGEHVVQLTQSSNVRFEQCRFDRCTSTGVATTAVDLSKCVDISVVECTFHEIQGTAVRNTGDPVTTGVQVVRCVVDGAGTAASATENLAGIHLMKSANVLVDGNTVTNCGSIGIAVDSITSPSFVRVINNAAMLNGVNGIVGQGHGIYVAGGGIGDYVVAGNIATENGGIGIEVNSVDGHRVVLANNVATGNGTTIDAASKGRGHGIWTNFRDAVVTGNVVTGNHGSGMALGYSQNVSGLNVQGNIVANNGQNTVDDDNPQWTSGIVIMTDDATDTTVSNVRALIQNNLIYDDTGMQQYGIYLDATVDGVVIEGNRLFGNVTEQIFYTPSTDMKVRRNEGFVTENASTADLATGERTVVVPHGLDVTPVASKIRLTALSNAGTYWVSDVTDVDFTIHRAGFPFPTFGLRAAQVGWSYAEN